MPFPERERKALETRRRLFRAAAGLIAREGWAATTVERICAQAGVAKGTFFVHFSTKDGLVEALVDQQVQAAATARARAAAAGAAPLGVARACVLELGRHAAKSREVSRAVLAAAMGDAGMGGLVVAPLEALGDALRSDLQAAVTQGDLAHTQVEPLLLGLLHAYYGAIVHWCASAHAPPLVQTLTALVDLQLEIHRPPAPPRRSRRASHSPPARAPGRGLL